MNSKLKWESKPILNILYKQNKVNYADDYLKTTEKIRQKNITNYNKNDLVRFHKVALGKQLCCFIGLRKYWVWEGSVKINEHHTARWRAFVSNSKGICFEVDTGIIDVALACWEDYKDKIGI